jgi:hypothetical protein
MKTGSEKLAWGARLLALAYVWLAVQPVLSLIYRNDPGVEHRIESGAALVCIALIVVEIMIALVPLRRGEGWAFWAAVAPLVIAGIPRLLTDSACQLADMHHHGCHQFMAAMLLGVIGLALSGSDIFKTEKAVRTA